METVKINSIKTNPKNPRLIKDNKFKKLVSSIVNFPEMLQKRPIVVDENNIILGGNMRYKACIEAGIKEIPIIKALDWTEEQKAEFIIKDNVSFGEWEHENLANEWDSKSLLDWGVDDFNIENSFLEEVNSLKELAKNAEEDFNLEEIQTEIKEGDIIQIGDHFLMCCDSYRSENILKLVDNSKIDLLFTDPMYQDTPKPIIDVIDAVNVDNILIMATFKQCIDFVSISNYRFRFDLVLNQKIPSSSMNKKVPYYLHKNIIYLTKNNETIFNCDNSKGFFSEKGFYPSVIESAKNTREEHGLTKNPEGLLMILSGFKFKSLLDMFIGSGSTMIASHLLGATCYGAEIIPKNCQIVINRMKALDPNLKIKINGIDVT